MEKIFVWLVYYLSIKYMLLNYIDDQIANDFFFEYRHIEAIYKFNYQDINTLKWWLGFDILAIILDFFSFFFWFWTFLYVCIWN